ncbi:MAG: hypothetical protein AAF587_19885 [Bacteroidota bacterium]
MLSRILSFFTLLCLLLGLNAFDSPEPKAVVYKQVQRQKVSNKLIQNLRKSPRARKAVTFETGAYLRAKAGFKLFNYQNVTILVKDSKNTFGSSIQGKDIKYFKFKFDIVIVPICECNQGSDDCELLQDHQGAVECRGSICMDCVGGFDIFGGIDEIPEVISPW